MTRAEQEILAIYIRDYPQEVLRALAPVLLEQWTAKRKRGRPRRDPERITVPPHVHHSVQE